MDSRVVPGRVTQYDAVADCTDDGWLGRDLRRPDRSRIAGLGALTH